MPLITQSKHLEVIPQIY